MTFKVQIECKISTRRSLIPFFKTNSIIQAKVFKLGFKIINIGDEPISGMTLQDIEFRSASGQNIIHGVKQSFHIDTLNPNHHTVIWVDEFGTYMHGLADVKMNVIPDDKANIIETYQIDQFTKKTQTAPERNRWLDFVYVRSKIEEIQKNTSLTIAFLTFVMTIGVFFNIYLFIILYWPQFFL